MLATPYARAATKQPIKVSKFRVWDKASEASAIIFLEIPEFPYNTTPSIIFVAETNPFSLFDTIPACVRQTPRHSIHRSICIRVAYKSRDKNADIVNEHNMKLPVTSFTWNCFVQTWNYGDVVNRRARRRLTAITRVHRCKLVAANKFYQQSTPQIRCWFTAK